MTRKSGVGIDCLGLSFGRAMLANIEISFF